MKRCSFFYFLFLTFSFQLASGQNAKPEWQFAAVKNADNNIVIHIEATIPAGTILYSGTNSEEYPGTTVVFDSSIKKQIEIISVTEQGALKKKDAQLDNAMVAYFEKKFSADVIIRIKNELPVIKGNVSFMGFNGTEFTGPDLAEFYFKKQADGNYSGGKHILTEATGKDLLLSNIDLKNPVSDCGVKVIDEAHSSLFSIFLLGFLGGLFALITPCVFPMIPLTVSFFTKKEGDRSKGVGRAFLYGLFIFLIYLSLSIPFQVAGKVNPEIYNNISTNVYLNLFFFVIFVVFAISFFGYFEITLPSSLANKADSKRGKGILGIFFMALTLAIVSFSCTGPILGVLLAGTASQGPWPLTAGLAGFGLALGFPFALFALFPQWLSSLPRSGGWMTTVKVVLGFVELALALKFLSNADLVMHWGILKREIFFAIWILISLASFAYLMGWFSFKKEYVKAKIGIARKIIAFVFLAFALYLFPGVTNTKYANVSLVSGFPPPAFYSIYGGQKPLDDYFAALKLAKEKNRPVMIDFTGWSCVNCRKMEENVWPSEKVKEQMDKFILVSLYVDDKKNLPEEDQFIYKAKDGSSKKIITIGDKWATLQSENFNAVSQPWYVLISPDGKLLTPPVGYTPDKSQYAKWLACGYEAFLKSGK